MAMLDFGDLSGTERVSDRCRRCKDSFVGVRCLPKIGSEQLW